MVPEMGVRRKAAQKRLKRLVPATLVGARESLVEGKDEQGPERERGLHASGKTQRRSALFPEKIL